MTQITQSMTYVAKFMYGWFDSIWGGSASGVFSSGLGRRASPYSKALDMNRLTAPRYASPISYRKINCSRGWRIHEECIETQRTSKDSDNVRTSSFVRYPSLFLSWRLKNHSMFSIRSLNITPFRPQTRSYLRSGCDRLLEIRQNLPGMIKHP